MRRIHYPFPLGTDTTFGQDINSYALGWPLPGDSYNPSAPGSTFDIWNTNIGHGVQAQSSSVVVLKSSFSISGKADGFDHMNYTWMPPPMRFILLPPVVQIDNIVVVGGGSSFATTSIGLRAAYESSPGVYVGDEIIVGAIVLDTDPGWVNSGGDSIWTSTGAPSTAVDVFMGGSFVSGSMTKLTPASTSVGVQIQFRGIPNLYQFPFTDTLMTTPANQFVMSVSNSAGGAYSLLMSGTVLFPIIPLG